MKNREYKNCIILGGGGHAAVLIECIRASRCAIFYGILDADQKQWRKQLLGIDIIGGDELLSNIANNGVKYFVVGLGSVGDNKPRQRLFELGCANNLEALTIVHPSALCSASAEIGHGVQLLPNSIVNARAVIKANTIVNSGAIVEHDCYIGNHVHIATGAKLASAVSVGDGVHIGIGATIKQCIKIGERSIVGAGAVVVDDVPDDTVVVGNPARFLKKTSQTK
ncbi:MAG: NeuD/PglB/VioB family sugar acetyltransferase [Pseudomonadota bacterium]